LNRTGRTVNTRNVECFVDRITGIETIKRTVSGKCPVAISIDTEVTDSAGYCSFGERIIGIVDIVASERTTSTDSCIDFSDCLTIRANSRGIIRTIDGYLNRAGCTVNASDVKSLVNTVTDIQTIERTISSESPIAGRVDCECADTTIDCGRAKFIVRIINISTG